MKNLITLLSAATLGSLISIPSLSAQTALTKLVLIDANSDSAIENYDPLPPRVGLIYSDVETTSFNIEAVPQSADVKSVRFELDDSQNYRIDSTEPFSLAGDDDGDFYSWMTQGGSHTVRAIPYSEPGGQGTPGEALSALVVMRNDPKFSKPWIGAEEAKKEIYQESNGIVVFEAENAVLNSSWEVRPSSPVEDESMKDSKGVGWLEWRGSQTYGTTKPASAVSGVIEYRFKIETEGLYTFRWRSKQYRSVASADAGNDTFVSLESGTAPDGIHDFSNFTKVWIQDKDQWSWRTTAESAHAVFHNNTMQRYYEPGEHVIKFAGRSPGHAIDRLALHHSSVSFNATSFTSMAESKIVGANDSARLINISTRGNVGSGSDILIGGFVIEGDLPKTVLIQGVGPELDIESTLSDPSLVLWSGQLEVARNDDWEDADEVARSLATLNVGATSLNTNSKSAALLLVLEPGIYTVGLMGSAGDEGVALVEIYEVGE